jgi:hypothetical protein
MSNHSDSTKRKVAGDPCWNNSCLTYLPRIGKVCSHCGHQCSRSIEPFSRTCRQISLRGCPACGNPFGMTQDTLKELLHYDPETGVFRWLVRLSNRSPVGSVAGAVNGKRYRIIGIKGKVFYAHRLAWAITHGHWPECHIDHINGDTLDNRIQNLRLATRHQNGRNRGVPASNTSGFKGVSFDRKSGKWRVQVSGKHIGLFATIEAAAVLARVTREKLHGEFARHE